MAIHFNQSTIAPIVTADGVARQPLLNKQRVPDILFELDRLTISSGGHKALALAPGELAWFQMIDGTATMHTAGRTLSIAASHIGLLPPGFEGTLSSDAGATLLFALVPDVQKLDPGISREPPIFRVLDWQDEPLLESEHDARKRIYLVTPKMFGIRAMRGEMIIYPPGTAAANHHHVGAEHFMYVLRGRGTVYANEKPFPVRAGDVIYYPDRERHYLEAPATQEMVFAEFFSPGEFKTVWVDESQICTWRPTGRDIRGQTPAREIKRHSVAEPHPEDV